MLSALAEQPVALRPSDDLAERILTHCLGRLSDPRLSPESVARAHHISVRYLHKVLQRRGVSLASWVRSRRLERIRRDLADPALVDRSVSVIAAGWGYLDAAHLSRALRAEYGRSAVEIRAEAVRAVGGGGGGPAPPPPPPRRPPPPPRGPARGGGGGGWGGPPRPGGGGGGGGRGAPRPPPTALTAFPRAYRAGTSWVA
ncbi:helix-turn-helix domain-containing protein [Streptomyces tsukubensis]|uniref:helix-turn-helix domain-containing protein n=1 Tax=Streptomyces tsukubensis TaxID=83656 RepID=UPI00367E4540